jgi:hypothetical protein
MTIRTLRYREKIYAILNHDNRISARRVAARLGCDVATVHYHRRAWRRQKAGEAQYDGPRCQRCEMAPLDTNPLINGICLWCWVQDTGLDIRAMAGEMGWEHVLAALTETVDVLCTYCREPAFTPAFSHPPMCPAHYECAVIISRVARRGHEITIDNLLQVYHRYQDRFTVTAEELPGLFQDMEVSNDQ